MKYLILCISVVLTTGLFAENRTLTILHTNDMHGHVIRDAKRNSIGLSAVSAYAKAMRAEKPILLLDAGDCVSGTPLSQYTDGVAIYDIMNKVGYDALVLGNHEFDYGWKTITKYKETAEFPLLSLNVFTPKRELLADKRYILKTVGGLKVGIIGVTANDAMKMTTQEGNEGILITDDIKELTQLVPIVREKCDLVVVLSHCGIDRDITIGNSVTGIDLIIGGHSHTDLTEAITLQTGTYVVQAHAYCQILGQIDLECQPDTKGITSLTWTRLSTDECKGQDPAVDAAVAEWQKKLPPGLFNKVGRSTRTLLEIEAKAVVQDAMTKAVGADLAFQNITGIRDKMYEGDIIERDLHIMHPFGNTISVVEILGKNIGGRLKRELVADGVDIMEGKVYRIATNSFIAQKPASSLGKPIIRIIPTETLVRDAVKSYLQELEVLDVAPPPDKITGTAMAVYDGDTIKLLTPGRKQIRVRFHGIDAPEKKQAFGPEARDYLASLVNDKPVTLHYLLIDKYGRMVCKVYAGETYVNLAMVEAGYAWHYRKYAQDEGDLSKAEAEAKAARRGLWVDNNPVPPWDFRHGTGLAAKTASTYVEPEAVPTPEPAVGGGEYWLNTSSKTRHNKTCKYYMNTRKGRACTKDEGKPCKACGG